MKKKTAEIKCYSGLNPEHDRLWRKAKEYIHATPNALEFECQVQLLFVSLEIEIEAAKLVIAYFSAVEDESIDWMLSRLEHEKSKTA